MPSVPSSCLRPTEENLAGESGHSHFLLQYDTYVDRAAQKWRKTLGPEDAQQAAYLGLLTALERFDPSRGVKLETYGWGYIHDALRDARKSAGNDVPFSHLLPNSDLDESQEDFEERLLVDENDPDERLYEAECSLEIHHFIKSLSVKERYLIDQVHWQGRSQTDVADELGLTRAAISKSLQVVYKKGREALTEYSPTHFKQFSVAAPSGSPH